MLTKAGNRTLTQVGPGTPMGLLMRRYWHPVAAAAELDESPVKEVRLLGEDLVLYRDRSGNYGAIDRYCAHRRVNLAYGIPEERGLRCMYHGWLYDETGQCIEQPFEETVRPDARFKDKVKLTGYRVQELAGMVFVYMGPEPAPLLPRWAPLVWDNAVREIVISELPCNWLQCMENSLDPVHTEWLHYHYTNYLQERKEGTLGQSFPQGMKHKKIGFDLFEYGVVKRRLLEGRTEEDSSWSQGHPVLFPHILLGPGNVDSWLDLQYRVPVDDVTTLHLTIYIYRAAPGHAAPRQERVPHRYVSMYNERGELDPPNEHVIDQDKLVWIVQGQVSPRHLEHLGESDRGIIMYRKLLEEQIGVVEDGGDPLGLIRDPLQNEAVDVMTERDIYREGRSKSASWIPMESGRSPAHDDIETVLATWAGE